MQCKANPVLWASSSIDMLKIVVSQYVVLQHVYFVSGQIKECRTLAFGQNGSSWHVGVLKMVLIILRQ